MQLRQATLADVPSVLALIRRVVPSMLASGNLQWDDLYPNAQVFEHDVALNQLWLAEVDGELAGVVAITSEKEPEYAHVGWDFAEPAIVIHRLAVDPSFRGHGIAAALMSQAETVARTSGLGVLRTDTSADNQATQRLFPKLGYTFSGEISLQFRPGMRVLCYEKRLETHVSSPITLVHHS